jgi:hypothetical protein
MSEMNDGGENRGGGLGPEQKMSALFAGLVVNQTQLALMLLGKLAHPGTGQTVKDLDGAKMFIDQLEMLEAKTKGNLDEQERRLLREQLTSLRMAFVEATTEPTASSKARESGSIPDAATGPQEGEGAPEAGEPAEASTADVGDSRKKFSKKY